MRLSGWEGMARPLLQRVNQEGFSDEIIFEPTPERIRGLSYLDLQRKGTPEKGHSKCKGLRQGRDCHVK